MESSEALLLKFIQGSYVQQGLQNDRSRNKLVQQLLQHRKIPLDGWNDQTIEYLLSEFANFDSNNFSSNCGVGEREGRVFSSLVAKRHFYLSHGIGRSGDIAEVQPKAAGSSIIYKLANQLVGHAMELAGIRRGCSYLVLPMATGMSIAMSLIALKKANPSAKYVLWSRIDQKSCFKAIQTAGLEPLIVDTVLSLDADSSGPVLDTNVEGVRSCLEQHRGEVLCVLSTTSCFAPRQPDQVDCIAALCSEFEVAHVINNAYGVQCPAICKTINRAMQIGRVDAVIQSTDKNFMVPVGGAVVMSPAAEFISAVSSSYPGRASMTPVLDVFITLLSMGQSGYLRLLQQRQQLAQVLQDGLRIISLKFGLQPLSSPRNSISFALSISALRGSQDLTFLGSMLYQRSVSGCRVVKADSAEKRVAGFSFRNWGAHNDQYPDSYLTAACSIGSDEKDIRLFLGRLEKALAKFTSREEKSEATTSVVQQPVDATGVGIIAILDDSCCPTTATSGRNQIVPNEVESGSVA